METILKKQNEFLLLHDLIVEDTPYQVIYEIPPYIDIDVLGNRENLLKLFSDVHINYNRDKNTRVICFKRQV